MPDRTQDLKNLRAVATACKNYTDKKAEEIYWHIGEYSISTSDDNTTASSKIVPSGATRCKIKRIYGNTVKNNPTVASNTDSYSIKTMPTTVYDFDVSKVEGNSEVSENLLVLSDVAETTVNGITYKVENGVLTLIRGTATGNFSLTVIDGFLPAGTYYFKSFGNDLGSNTTYFSYYQNLDSSDVNSNVVHSYDNKTVTLTQKMRFQYRVMVRNGESVSNVQFKDMLTKGSTAPTEFKQGYTGIHNFEWNGIKVEGANLFDKSNVLDRTYINTSGGLSTETTDGWITSQPIEIIDSVSYNFNTIQTRYRLLNDSQNYIASSYVSTTNASGTITNSVNAKYIQFSIRINDKDTFMVSNGSTIPTTYQSYITPIITTIDLSSITYNGSPLFEENSLKAVGTAKDYITPYLAHKEIVKIVLNKTDYDWQLNSSQTVRYINNFASIIKRVATNTDTPQMLCDKLTKTAWDNLYNETVSSGISISSNGNIGISISDYENLTTLDVVFVLATPIEVSIDWSSLLRGIQGYSKGTITLQNTHNMDTANTITYNSTITENCCAKMVQSRGGSVIKTINFPTQASDGYSARNSYNVRDFTTNKRIENIYKLSKISDLTWDITTTRALSSALEIPTKDISGSVTPNILTIRLETIRFNAFASDNLVISATTSGNSLIVRDTSVLNNNNSSVDLLNIYGNDSVYYERKNIDTTDITPLDTNIIEVEPNDVFTFYDSNDNEVAVPSDLTYRIEVAN